MTQTWVSQTNSSETATRQYRLPSGINVLLEPMPGYHTATVMVRIIGGIVSEPDDRLGLAYITEQSLDKGTAHYGAREFANAFDALGASYAVHTGLESWVFIASALPEFIGRTIDLLGELLFFPTFPDDAVETAVTLAQQELIALEDSPQSILRREMVHRAYGPLLGRHRLGTTASLSRIKSDHLRQHWNALVRSDAVTIAVTGNIDEQSIRATLERALSPIKSGAPFAAKSTFRFQSQTSHVTKDLEQTQIGISFPGVSFADPDYYVEKLLIEVLSGGMGARLFTEVREKQGLVYWVSAWHEQPRTLGMIHLGAATTPERCHRTLETLLREVARLEHDLTEEELERAKIGLLAERKTTGASVHQRAAELLTDYFQLGRVVTPEQRVAAIKRVTSADIKRYLKQHPRRDLSVVTVGPKPIDIPKSSAESH